MEDHISSGELPMKPKEDSELLLLLDEETREVLWRNLGEIIENYTTGIRDMRIGPILDPAPIRAALELVNFDRAMKPCEALEYAVKIFMEYQVHTAHPRFFGQFDPAPATMGIIAETLVAAFNPQLSVWSQSPGPVELESLLVSVFGEKFGYKRAAIDGTFTYGGAEANHTALLTALTYKFPRFRETGLRAIDADPVLYVSSEAHHSVLKAASSCGLGKEAVREIEVDQKFRMDVRALSDQIARDKKDGFIPFLVVGTVGTTSAGAVDPLLQLAEVAGREGLWLHADAAWGGACALVPEMQGLIAGIERADSITFDPHKWLSVSRGAGLYLTRHKNILTQTFDVAAAYMPRIKPSTVEVIDQFRHSMAWSRRFTGLKVFLTLAVAGWEGYARVIRAHTAMGDYLRQQLERSRWEVLNDAALAVVCFVDKTHPDGSTEDYLDAIRDEVLATNRAWISITRLAKTMPVLRACIVNYRTSRRDVDELLGALNAAREKQSNKMP
jgi:glutamate/tyrosine decarboxylase-like PLP-dependent enzyme